MSRDKSEAATSLTQGGIQTITFLITSFYGILAVDWAGMVSIYYPKQRVFMNRSKVIKRVTLIMAMFEEANAIITSLNMREDSIQLNPKLPMRLFQTQQGELEVSLVINGVDDRYQADYIGCEAATLASYEVICQLKPDLIISAGTAGGFEQQGAKIGTVYLSADKFVYHDRHVPLAGFKDSAIGHYPAAQTSKMARELDMPSGIISSGSSLEKFPSDITVIEGHNAVAKEMESAAIAWVAMLFDVPVMAVKSITNLIDQNNKSEDEFIANLAFSSEALHQQVLIILGYLEGKSLEDLSLD